MRLLRATLLSLGLSGGVAAQSYLISTYAGGTLPVNIAGVSTTIGGSDMNFSGLATDPAGNVLFSYQSSVLRWDAISGLVTLVAGSVMPGYSGDGGMATAAQLISPHGIVVDSKGNIYIADNGNMCIRKITNGIISTIAGKGSYGYSGDNGPALNAPLGNVQGLAVNSAGDLFLADADFNVVRKVSNGIITTLAGTGAGGYNGDGISATSAQLNEPYALAADSAGNIYIADTMNSRVRVVSPTGTINTVAGTGQVGHAGDGGQATLAKLAYPFAVAVGGNNLYISDSGRFIRMISGGIITTIAGSGSEVFDSDNQPAVSAGLNASGVAVDATGNIYIYDAGNGRIRKVAGGTITSVVGGGSPGDGGAPAKAQLLSPEGVLVDASGNVFIADSGANRVRKVSNGIITTVAGTGYGSYNGDGQPGVSAMLANPVGLAQYRNEIFIADLYNCRLRGLLSGTIQTVAGSGQCGYTGDNQSATTAELMRPRGVAFAAPSILYIADTGNNVIRRVANGTITTFAGNGSVGFGGDGGPATSASFNFPSAVAVDSSGAVYIADALNNRIRKVSGGTITTVAGGGDSDADNIPATAAQLWDPFSVTVDSSGNLYIPESGLVRKVSNGIITTIAGGGDQIAENIPATNYQLSRPFAVAVDSSGKVYIADAMDGRILLLTPYTPAVFGITKSHTGSFAQGQNGASFTVTVSNAASAGPTIGTVTVTDTIPAGLEFVSMAGPGWTCPPSGHTCTRGDVLQPGFSYPPITVIVNVLGIAPASLVNSAMVSGGGAAQASASDPVTVLQYVPINIQATPSGLKFSVDGGGLQTAPLIVNLLQGNHTIAVATPQAGAPGVQYAFNSWSDGGAASHTIAVSAAATYTAAFTAQYQLSLGASPSGTGSVTANPASSTGWYDQGTAVQLIATPAAGYQFSGWTGDLTGAPSTQTITMNAPHNVVAHFTPIPPAACSFAFSPAANLPATGTSTVETCPNNSGQPNCGVIPESPVTFTVTPGATCGAWTATSSNPSVLRITSGGNGRGPGTVGFTLLNNTHTGQQTYSITVSSGVTSADYIVTQAGSGNNQVYREVYALYEQFLGRDPDPAGFAFWTGSGGAGLGQMADSFLTSPEAFNSDFVVMAAYQAATGAPPTFAAYTAAVASLRAGTLTVDGLFASLVGAGYSAANLYENLLSRAPGPADASCYALSLSQCFQTIIGYPASVTPVGAPNNEFQNRGTYSTGPDHSNTLYVQMIYYVTVSRNPDAGGFAFWLNVANTSGPGALFQGGGGYATRIQILGPGTPTQGFIGSPEFQGLFAN